LPIRENKFARRVREREKELDRKGIVRDAQPTVDEQLGRLEEDVFHRFCLPGWPSPFR
jgi:hypothetical protein